jgi:hypothetical protein
LSARGVGKLDASTSRFAHRFNPQAHGVALAMMTALADDPLAGRLPER